MRTKHINLIFGTLIVAGIGLLSYGFLKSKRSHASLSSNVTPAPITDKQRSALKGEVETYLTQVRKSMGEDAIGDTAYVIFLRQVAPEAVAQNAKIKDLCTSQKTCPFSLATVFELGLARLDTALDSKAKQILQTQLVNSDLPIDTKRAILARNLVSTKLYTLPPKSAIDSKDQVQLGVDIQYMIVTSKQLQILGFDPDQYLKIIFATLEKSRDQVARRLIVKGLIKGYPHRTQEIQSQAHKIGINIAAN